MTIAQHATRRFATPFITGRAALLLCILAVALPTLIRVSVDAYVTELAFIPYAPFVVLAAIFLAWQYAAIVAFAATIIGDAYFVGPPPQLLEDPNDIFGVLAFLTASTIIIAFTHLTRRTVQHYGRLCEEHPASSGIVFSLEAGQAWASWYGSGAPVCLGPQGEVSEMMEDFLAQVEFGKRLTANQPISR